ncbi:MAG: uncharacterized protein QOE79_2748 [Sphingomonadales bacterium]|jgi:hypothetical protein|nr:uncharacterized protein [Sphingomonadales bacterium]MEA3049717.1 uncharacterized protein [Sphingomonadales bacterium]
MILFLALAVAAASPTPEGLRLGRALSESGTLAALMPMVADKEIGELVAAHPELSEADRTALRATARATYQAGRDRLMEATGRAYAERLSVADLRALVAFNRTPAAAHYRAAVPGAIASAMQAVGQMDFKKDAVAAFCRKTGKLCEGK